MSNVRKLKTEDIFHIPCMKHMHMYAIYIYKYTYKPQADLPFEWVNMAIWFSYYFTSAIYCVSFESFI